MTKKTKKTWIGTWKEHRELEHRNKSKFTISPLHHLGGMTRLDIQAEILQGDVQSHVCLFPSSGYTLSVLFLACFLVHSLTLHPFFFLLSSLMTTFNPPSQLFPLFFYSHLLQEKDMLNFTPFLLGCFPSCNCGWEWSQVMVGWHCLLWNLHSPSLLRSQSSLNFWIYSRKLPPIWRKWSIGGNLLPCFPFSSSNLTLSL